MDFKIENRIGEVGKNNFGTLMKIIEYKNCDDIVIEFQDQYKCQKNTTYVNFRRGQVKNPYDKTACGVGYVGEGKYLTKENGRSTKLYSCWVHMLERCYYEKNQNLHQSYYGTCSVCDEWLNFQTFAKWYEEHSYEVNERLHLDKDILFPGNKIYAPDKCILVPQRINELFSYKPKNNGLPVGISKTKSGKYVARYNGEQLGIYDTLDKSYEAYAKKKEEIIKRIAEQYRAIIPQELYNALIRYKVDINNDRNYIK